VLIVSVIVQSNCHILQFLHQMFNVSALMLDDALLKCVVTEVVMFSIVACKTLDISQVSVATQLRCGGIFSKGTITILCSDSESKIILKIDYYLVKFRPTKNCAIFGPPCVIEVQYN